MSEALAVIEEAPLVPMSMGTTFHAYTSMQKEIDKAMPDQIMTIQGRQFRKKGYWRAVRAAFGLKVWCVSEERLDVNGEWGYSVLYRAEGRNGMSADGDGVCMASEKRGAGQATVHNVRSHAHTRAFNRAVSNLVGFGEVSAEEVERDDHQPVVVPKPAPKPMPKPAPVVAAVDAIPFEPPDLGPDADLDATFSAESNEPAVYVTKVDQRKGSTNGKDWIQYFIETSDGNKAAFFDGQLAVAAQAALASNAPVICTFEQKGKYKNLVSILRAS